jgi:hypothetical protein
VEGAEKKAEAAKQRHQTDLAKESTERLVLDFFSRQLPDPPREMACFGQMPWALKCNCPPWICRSVLSFGPICRSMLSS